MQSSLRERVDVDQCAEIDVSATTSGAIVAVTLSDGRTGLRSRRQANRPARDGWEAIALLPPPVEPVETGTPPMSSPSSPPPRPRRRRARRFQFLPRPSFPSAPAWAGCRFPQEGLHEPRCASTSEPPSNSVGAAARGECRLARGSRCAGPCGYLVSGRGGRGTKGLRSLRCSWLRTVGVGAEIGLPITLGRIGVVALVEPSVDAVSQAPRYGTARFSARATLAFARVGGELHAMILSEQRLRFFVRPRWGRRCGV